MEKLEALEDLLKYFEVAVYTNEGITQRKKEVVGSDLENK